MISSPAVVFARRFALRATLGVVGVIAAATPAAAQLSPTSGTTADEDHKDEAPRFYGLGLDYSLYGGTNFRSVDTNNNSTIDQYFTLSWNFGRLWARKTPLERMGLSARFNVSNAIFSNDPGYYSANHDTYVYGTCSDLTPSPNGTVDPTKVGYCPRERPDRTDYGDLWLTLRFPQIATIPKVGISFSPSVRYTAHTSQQMRAMGGRGALAAIMGLSGAWFKGKLTVGYTLIANGWFGARSGNIQYRAGDQVDVNNVPVMPWQPMCSDTGTNAEGQGLLVSSFNRAISNRQPELSGVTPASTSGCLPGNNPRVTVSSAFSIGVNPHEKVSLSAQYILIDQYSWSAAEQGCTYTVNGQVYDVCQKAQEVAAHSGSSVRDRAPREFQWFLFNISYSPLDWLSLSANWITATPRRWGDNTLRQPFINTTYDGATQVSFGASFSIEGIADKIFPKKKAEVKTAAVPTSALAPLSALSETTAPFAQTE